ncbi:DUF1491 family protein [Sandaracinobacteroides saxicola]|uniref:DUF1491 family protein n=1 Tax=Sandaracinobacteroides saxicola TaxID=2759707 RepID=A0A7G5IHG6_9SPHN|nr:DUF1491 family protein [Sandaracinobacteroides saxicola]QMW22808.1 DUF1491 family protein [Sandaracinobacteroides saxicola]
MSDLPSGLWVSGLMRRVQAAGGFATLIARGEAERGNILLLHRDAGGVRAWERVPDVGSGHRWRVAAEDDESVTRFVARQQRFDPDLWVVELDVPHLQRFIDGMCDKS